MHTEPKIVKARIQPSAGLLRPPVVFVVYDNDLSTEVKLFDYYPDEISFTESEFILLTESEARWMKHQKDVAYLQS
jgi:hypothetical protein